MIAVVLLGLLHAAEPPFQPRHLAFSPDGKALAVGGARGKLGDLRVIDTETGKPRWRILPEHAVGPLAWSPDGKTLFAVTGAEVELLDASNGKLLRRLGPHGKRVRCLALSADGNTLATGGEDRTIRLWNVALGTRAKELAGHPGPVRSVAFSSDGKRLLSTGGEEARLWDLEGGKTLHRFAHENSTVSAGVFASRGEVAITGGWDGQVRIWDVASGKQRLYLEMNHGTWQLAFHEPTHALLLWSDHRRDVAVADLNLAPPDEPTAKKIAELLRRLDDDRYETREGATRQLLALGFVIEPTLRRAVAESASAEVRIRARGMLAALTTKPRLVLRGHRDNVRDVAFSPDGKTVATVADDGTLRLWEVVSGKERATLLGVTPRD